MGELLDRVRILKDEEGEAVSKNSTEWLLKRLQNPDAGFKAVKAKNMYVGKFYFLMYDMEGKSSKMEQFSPILLVDFRKVATKKLLYGISLNFIPQNIRLLFFDAFLDSFENVFLPIDSQEKVGNAEKPLPISFQIAFEALDKIGFQYVIRELDADKINKAYEVSMQTLPRYMTVNTTVLTDVDEKKMAEIWLSKLKNREEAVQKRISELITSYEDVAKTFSKEFKSYEREFEKIQKSKDNLKSLGLR
jgi:hypothetical protein